MDPSELPVATSAGHMQQLGTRTASCPAHGTFVASGRRLGKREMWTTCQACALDQQEAERAAEALRQAKILARRREEVIGQACIPKRFRDLSFHDYLTSTPEQGAVLAKVREYAETFANRRACGAGLVLAGTPGTGKTHLAAALMLHLLGGNALVQYLTCMELIRLVRGTWGKHAERTERQMIQTLGLDIDLLVIDEVGVQYGTESEQHILFEVLDKRYAEMRPTVLITNLSKVGFINAVGERVADRLTQTHDWLVFDWPSHRRQARAAA